MNLNKRYLLIDAGNIYSIQHPFGDSLIIDGYINKSKWLELTEKQYKEIRKKLMKYEYITWDEGTLFLHEKGIHKDYYCDYFPEDYGFKIKGDKICKQR